MRRTFVKPEGVIDKAKIVLVGEQPGRTEVFSGRPFVGPSGRELNECLIASGIARSDCYITNAIKDLDEPTTNYVKSSKKGVSFSPNGLVYQEELFQELAKFKGSVIVAIGNIALTFLTDRYGINNWRGSILTSDRLPGKYIIPTLHPATIIPPKNNYLNKILIQFDLLRAAHIMKNGFVPTIRRRITMPSFNDVLSYLQKAEGLGLGGTTVDFDIEIYNEEVSCISIVFSPNEAMSIPFVDHKGDYFLADQEVQIWKKIGDILENPDIKIRGQNFSFDAHFLLRKYRIKSCNIDDTMVAQKTIMPDFKMGLDFITSVWTDQIYYKDEGKKYFSGGNWLRLWKYNATDSLMTAEAFPKQLQKLEQQNNVQTYQRQVKLIEPLVYMQERGIKVDIEGIKKMSLEMTEKAERLQEELSTLVGYELNPNSPKQLKEYFYGKLGVKPYMSRTTKKETTDDTAMKRLYRRGFKEAGFIRDIRKAKKLNSVYLNLDNIDKDGRIRCSYNPSGTRYSRISSSKNIFGTGANLQNWPHEILKFLIADDDHIIYNIDLSQAENRIVAQVGNIKPMIDAFEKGSDVHTLTASLIFQKPPEEITTEDGTCSLGDGSHSERFFGKKANHGLNYDLGFRVFALLYEIPEAEAKFIVNRYHLAYPGVRNNFHVLVRRFLRDNRTITNLMGRRTQFLDKWGDKLFKEAYSCIPQGTVGDIINERGMNFIYYNQDKFKFVDLLIQVHDSIGFQIPTTLPWTTHAKILRQIKESLEIPLVTYDHREFIIPADISIGFNFYKKENKELKAKDFPSTDIGTRNKT